MALIYMDGFDAGDHTARWTPTGVGVVTRTLVPGRYGSGQALQFSSTTGNNAAVTRYFAPAATLFFGGAIKVTGTSSQNFQLVHFGSFGAANLGVWLTPSYGIILCRQTPSQELTLSTYTALTSASEGLVNGQWAYLEAMVTVADAGGRFILKKNGNTIIDYTGDTKTAVTSNGTDHVILSSVDDTSPDAAWDDVYIADDTGTTNNTFLGDIEVKALQPNANGTYSGFQGSDGDSVDNYQLVDDNNMTDYVASSVVGTKDSYNLPDLAGVTVKAVQTVVQGNQADGGSAAVRPFVRIAGTDHPASTQYLGQQTITTHAFDQSPATGSGWSLTEINNAEVGIEVV